MRKFNRILAAVLVVLALTVVIGPAVVKAVDVPGDVYVIPGSRTLVIEMTIGSKIIKVDGVARTIDASPQIKWSRTFAPIRFIIEALGGTITWNGETKTVAIFVGRKTILLVIGRNYALVNGMRVYIDANHTVAPWIQAPGRTMLPVRFISEQLGAFVMWSSTLQRVTLVFALPLNIP